MVEAEGVGLGLEVGDGGGVVRVGVGGVDSEVALEAGDWGVGFLVLLWVLVAGYGCGEGRG